jgi:hypothetical protein
MTANALRLKEYICGIEGFRFIDPEVCPYKDHIGALFTDSILQAGVNYRSVVRPRVEIVLKRFPRANTVSSFSEVLNHYGIKEVLLWNNDEKIHRMEDLISFCTIHAIETARDLTLFLNDDSGIEKFKEIKGIGNKTCDYLKRLLGFDIVAVDRHVRNFLEAADILYENYYDIKEVVEYAADIMEKSRRTLDYSIWTYMSQKKAGAIQLVLDF